MNKTTFLANILNTFAHKGRITEADFTELLFREDISDDAKCIISVLYAFHGQDY